MGSYVREHSYQTLAFEEFFALRTKGTPVDTIFKILGEKYHKSPHTIEEWYRKFKWPDRAVERENKTRQAVAERVEDSIETVIIQQRQIIKATLARYVEALQANKVKIGADTMKHLLEHQLILHGYNPYRPQVQVFQNTSIQNVMTKLGVLSEAGKNEVLKILEQEFSGLGGNDLGDDMGGDKGDGQ